MVKHLLLLGPVALILGGMIPERRRSVRLAAFAVGGLATALGAWNAYKKEADRWAS